MPSLPKQALAEELGPLYARGQLDGFNIYIYGIVLRALQPPALFGSAGAGAAEDRPRYPSVVWVGCDSACAPVTSAPQPMSKRARRHKDDRPIHLDSPPSLPSARTVLLKAACAYACNWSAWLDLAEVCLQEQR